MKLNNKFIAYLGSALLPTVATVQAQQKPNIIFLFADDLGWGDMGCYGHPDIKTPYIDALAKGGKLFTNWYVTAPVSSPSRASVLTGKMPQRDHIYEHFSTHEENVERNMPDWLEPNERMLPALLRKAGYTTAHFGKWHLSTFWDRQAPTVDQYGYDDYRCHGVVGNNQQEYVRNLKSGELQNTRSAQWEVDDALLFIRTNNNAKPFFVNMWFQVPHTILLANAEQKEPYKAFRAFGNLADTYYNKYGVAPHTTPHEVYYATITELDRQIGRLIAELKRMNIFENTLIVLSSDNGHESIDIPYSRHSGVGSAGIFRGEKRSLYEGGIRVPGIVSWPAGGVPQGVIDRESVVSCMDLYPTFLSLAGVKIDKLSFEGENRIEAFRNKSNTRKSPLFWEFNIPVYNKKRLNRSPRLAIREGDYKLLMSSDGKRKELYYLKTDPSEVDNIADSHADIVSQMSEKLMIWFKTLPNAKEPDFKAQTGYEQVLGIE